MSRFILPIGLFILAFSLGMRHQFNCDHQTSDYFCLIQEEAPREHAHSLFDRYFAMEHK